MLTKDEVIERYGTTAAQFARDLGTTRQAVYNWGNRIPANWALRVSRLTGFPVESLLDQASAKSDCATANPRDRE